MAPIDFTKALNRAVANDKKVWEHDRTQTVGASEVFGCIRRAYFTKREPDKARVVDVDDHEWGAMERGNAMELNWAVPKIKLMFGEANCLFMGDEQKTLIHNKLSSTSDGLVINQPRDILAQYGIDDIETGELAIEIKSVDPQTNLTEVKYRHKMQNIVQMGLYGMKTNFKPLFGVVMYFDPVNLKKMTPHVVRFDDEVFQNAIARAEYIFDKNYTAFDYKAEGKLTGECRYCPFAHECKEAEIRFFPTQTKKAKDIPNEELTRVETLSRRLSSLRTDIKALELDKATAEEELKTILSELGTKNLKGEDWSATYSQINGRKSLDSATLTDNLTSAVDMLNKLCADYPNEHEALTQIIDLLKLENFYREGQPYFRLTVKG